VPEPPEEAHLKQPEEQEPSQPALIGRGTQTIGQPKRCSFEEYIIMTTPSGHTGAIRAKKVIGTNVTDPTGTKIGQVEDVVLDKQSNNILFAVVGFGGFLGMAEKYHPIPWASLEYDETRNAYVVEYTKEQLKAAPAGSIDELTRSDGIAFRDRAYDYYKAPRYWDSRM
jgi:sporulation protein YlmC with PRC-barrel domain